MQLASGPCGSRLSVRRQTVGVSVRVLEVPWADPRATAMRAQMDVEMSARYRDSLIDRPPTALHIDPADIAVTCLAIDLDDTAVGHGALRWLRGELEVKRLIVAESRRGRGISYAVMGWLEERARTLGAGRLILQTGDRQPEAIHVYERLGYAPIEVYPPYDELPMSRCFAKVLP